eukprot:2180737-Pyramimonas_sp.AAC.1
MGAPSFASHDLPLLLCIDDRIGPGLYDEGSEQVEVDKEVTKKILVGEGLEVHKETWGPGQEKGLGLS